MSEAGCEVWFYHLERSEADEVLPELLDKARGRGWRALVVAGAPERLAQISARLWGWRDDSFLAHGRADEPEAARQPILLSTDGENRNGAQAVLLLDGAEPPPLDAFRRCIDLFDGGDAQAVAAARRRWTAARKAGRPVSYWRQTEAGGWSRQA